MQLAICSGTSGGTSELCLTFDATSGKRLILGYADADWGGCLDTRRSTTGYLFRTFGGPVAWKSRRQATTALSTAEAEDMASADATRQAVWLRLLLKDLGQGLDGPLTILNDNTAAILLYKNPVQHDRSKPDRDILNQLWMRLQHLRALE
jgi:hypothetical protein